MISSHHHCSHPWLLCKEHPILWKVWFYTKGIRDGLVCHQIQLVEKNNSIRHHPYYCTQHTTCPFSLALALFIFPSTTSWSSFHNTNQLPSCFSLFALFASLISLSQQQQQYNQTHLSNKQCTRHELQKGPWMCVYVCASTRRLSTHKAPAL